MKNHILDFLGMNFKSGKMNIEQIYTGCLAQGAYYIESNGEVAIIDPLREVEPYLKRANADRAKIKYIFETHFHADFVSGHITLSKETGAPIVYGPLANPSFDAIIAEDNQEFTLGGHSARINEVIFSKSGKYLASASSDGTCRLWETANYNNQPFVFRDNEAWAMEITFDSSEENFYCGYVDGTIQYWPVSVLSIADKMCNLLTRNLTLTEWEAFVAKDIPYEKTCNNIDSND